MTLDEAKRKYCPVRVIADPPAMCLTTECMLFEIEKNHFLDDPDYEYNTCRCLLGSKQGPTGECGAIGPQGMAGKDAGQEKKEKRMYNRNRFNRRRTLIQWIAIGTILIAIAAIAIIAITGGGLPGGNIW